MAVMSASQHHALLYRVLDARQAPLILQSLVANEEVHTYRLPAVQIDDVRGIIARAYRLPTEAPRQLIVIETPNFTHEAQQALLKILEEPPATTRFCLLVAPETKLLPTVLSRCQFMDAPALAATSPLSPLVEEFLRAAIPERLSLIASAHKDKNEEYFTVLQAGVWTKVARRDVVATSALESALRQLGQRGAAKKMLWEELAFRLPVEVN